MNNSRIPMLKKDASAQDIIQYLNWLQESPYAYHLDESPTDLIWKEEVDEEYINLLEWNHIIMFRRLDSEIIWSNYNPTI